MPRLVTTRQLTRAVEEASSSLEVSSDRSVRFRDIAAAIGMPERTLRHRFVVSVGTSPMRYLRQRRFMMVRQVLQDISTDDATITGVALRYRFSELGRFAVEYRRLFGESPSVTLRRAINGRNVPGTAVGRGDLEPARPDLQP